MHKHKYIWTYGHIFQVLYHPLSTLFGVIAMVEIQPFVTHLVQEIIEDIDQRLEGAAEIAEIEYHNNIDAIGAVGQHAIGNAGQPDVGDEHVDMNWYNDPIDGA